MIATLNLCFTQTLLILIEPHFTSVPLMSACCLGAGKFFERAEFQRFPAMAARWDKSSPALKQILLKLYREKPVEIDHHLYEFGSVEYHIQCSVSSAQDIYLSISTPPLSQGVMQSHGLSPNTIQMVKDYCSDAVEIVEPAKEGYHLTMKINFSKIPRKKDSEKVIGQISSVQAVILSSQLKEMLSNVNIQDSTQGMYKPIKLVYHPREPFYVIKQPQKITAVFPMRFKEYSDVIIATAFFQELMDEGSSEKWSKAPPCSWSPIPPPELRGESFEDLSTNGGFVSFDISSHHVEGKKLDKTVWNLSNFYGYVKRHVKCTRGYIQRRMRRCMESLVEVLQKASLKDDKHNEEVQEAGCRYMQKLVKLSKTKILKRRCSDFTKKIKRIRSRIKIHGRVQLQRRWLAMPKFSSRMGYRKLD
ncbi:actin-related protein 2/3 complex subunit 2B isoform X2 [Tripterygium wilfordii]|uniref:actin-related protein 2/3 complex subunit 2B isoform X2 n=1 Tax=Tripterygium wilfordii TaxID=458696 RepID=UPI0018F7F23B|nr:actin-related protein 2/3 complex subunit 2B isoform X2 [Tripterygium wilfordii]